MIERISSLILRRQRGHLLVILANRTIGGSTTKIAYFGKEADGCVLVPGPLIRQIILIEDGLSGAHRLAGATVDALVRIDVQRARTLINAIDGALVHASLVLDIHARLSNYVWHGILLTNNFLQKYARVRTRP